VFESKRAYTAGLDVNSNTNVAEYVGIIAPNNPETNLVGIPNTFESTQEKNADDARRLGFEVHGTIAADDPTDVDVYSFYGYGGSEVWFDIDKTTTALDTQLEILDASGNVLARSFDSINDIGVVRVDSSDPVTENAGGEAIVVGPEQAVTGIVGVADGVAANVQGAEQTVTGVVGVADGVAAAVQGIEQAATGVVGVADGVAAEVNGFEANAIGVWAEIDAIQTDVTTLTVCSAPCTFAATPSATPTIPVTACSGPTTIASPPAFSVTGSDESTRTTPISFMESNDLASTFPLASRISSWVSRAVVVLSISNQTSDPPYP
jgi:hypothetical protein